MHTAIRGGTLTRWRVWGDGPPEALLIHCSLGHAGAWSGFARRLGRRALAFDLPGHGGSGPLQDGVDFHDQATAMAADFLGETPVDVIGHSFGATVALRLAMAHPGRIRRLVLIEPVLFCAARGSAVYDAYIASARPFGAAMAAGDPAAAARFFTATWGTGPDWDDLSAAQRQDLTARIHIIPAEDAAIHNDSAGLLDPGRPEATALPILIIEGEDAQPIVHAVHKVLLARLPDAQRVVIAGAGHMAPITHPGAVAEMVGRFLG